MAKWPEIHVPDLHPDFRTMSEKDLRKGLTEINRAIRQMKKHSDHYFLVLDDLVELRKRYKIVWRARPGRTFHDVAARKKREKARRHNGPGLFFPFIP
jgi:hypothetical protein